MKDKLLPKATISRKLVMALTGLGLIGFLIMHLAGNLLVFVDAETFNDYAYTLISNPLIYFAEAALLLLFIYHAVDAVLLRLAEKRARPIDYEQSESLGRRTIYSKTMIWTGIIVLLFVIVHVATMKFAVGVQDFILDPVTHKRDLYLVVATVFQNPIWVIFYLICLACLGFHLVHALQSALRTLGLSHRRYIDMAKAVSLILAIVLIIGFSTIPIYFCFFYKGT